MADVGLIAKAVTTAPEGYQVPGAQEIIVKSVFAQYDGSGAGGDFVPTLQILAPSGAVVASCPLGQTVAAGSSVDVSWFQSGGIGVDGIQFDTEPQAGQFLYVETDGPSLTAGGDGMEFVDSSGGGVQLEISGTGNGGYLGQITGDGNAGWTFQTNGNYTANPATFGFFVSDNTTNGSGLVLQQTGGGQLTLEQSGGTADMVFIPGRNLIVTSLPTINPGVPGALWNNAGVVHVV